MMNEAILDCVLVPLGLLVMIAYHAWLLHRIVKQPRQTVIGVNAIIRRFWVREIMEDVSKNGVLAVQTLRNNIMASTLLASTATLTVSFIFTVLMTKSLSSGTTTDSFFYNMQGNGRQLIFAIKFFSIVLCFLVAFLFNIQSVRYYSHASILVNVPYKKIIRNQRDYQHRVEYVAAMVNRGGYFWSLGLRAFYFSFPLFLWIFGPVPMVASSFVLVFTLYKLDEPKCKLGSVAVYDDGDDEEVGIKPRMEGELTS